MKYCNHTIYMIHIFVIGISSSMKTSRMYKRIFQRVLHSGYPFSSTHSPLGRSSYTQMTPFFGRCDVNHKMLPVNSPRGHLGSRYIQYYKIYTHTVNVWYIYIFLPIYIWLLFFGKCRVQHTSPMDAKWARYIASINNCSPPSTNR